MGEDAFLRDRLAVHRTRLANERTILAYARTAIALVAAGASAIHFFEGFALAALGWTFIAVGVATIGIGVVRFQRTNAVVTRLAGPEPPLPEGPGG
ncbi:MAG: DUF202 domain-containing protein [Actinobacteria bacterium]|nr:DUF202 domain-containing protein [Actinomycetota bacterium]